MDPDDGAAGGTPCLTLVAPAILQGSVHNGQLGPAAFIVQLAPCRWPQGLPILGPAHRANRCRGLTAQSQVLTLCDCSIYELPGEDAWLL